MPSQLLCAPYGGRILCMDSRLRGNDNKKRAGAFQAPALLLTALLI